MLEQHLEEARLDQKRWIDTLHEKLPWCSDVSGDKYSIEAKLATVQELLDSIQDGEQKTDVLRQKVDLLKAVISPDKKIQLEEMKQLSQQDLRTITETLLQTK